MRQWYSSGFGNIFISIFIVRARIFPDSNSRVPSPTSPTSLPWQISHGLQALSMPQTTNQYNNLILLTGGPHFLLGPVLSIYLSKPLQLTGHENLGRSICLSDLCQYSNNTSLQSTKLVIVLTEFDVQNATMTFRRQALSARGQSSTNTCRERKRATDTRPTHVCV